MKVLSHRGYWKNPGEKNALSAFSRSLQLGFGLETDLRDCRGRIVVSHDMPVGTEPELDQLMELFRGSDHPLALNIKADGMAVALKDRLSRCDIKDWFAFDMSIPDMRSYLDHRMPVFARFSEVERDPPWLDEVGGIWFDSFHGEDLDKGRISEYLRAGKRVCIVSPELHGRQYQDAWQALRTLSDAEGVMICTDYPEQARRAFSNPE